MMLRFATVWMGLLLLSTASLAQSALGALAGTITNPDAGAVPGLEIQAVHIPTGQVFTAVSSKTGGFTFTGLPAGEYEISLQRVGFSFAAYSKKDLRVEAGKTLREDVRLQWHNLGTVGEDMYLALKNKYPDLYGPVPRMPDGKPDISGVWFAGNPA